LALVHPVFLPGGGGRDLFPAVCPLYPCLSLPGKSGLTVTIYLIGTGISKSALKQVGVRPLLPGILLWGIIAAGSLALIRHGLIAI
jgi:hypothetical protein